MYLMPPMADEPPPEYVAFVTTHVTGLRDDAARLTGGDPDGTHLYMDALADAAGHWRRLTVLGRVRRTLSLPGPDAAGAYVARRLASRTKRWREEQVYDIDVRILTEHHTYAYSSPAAGSIALRKATLLPSTARAAARPLADAAIAWVQAYRRALWRRLARTLLLTLLTITALTEWITWLSAGSGN